MQNKTDKETSLVSKTLPVEKLDSVNRSFPATKKKCYVSQYEICGEHVPQELERILLYKASRYRELEYKYTYVDDEYYADDLDEYCQD